jgi:YVTN family beta-propeller protein
MYTTEGFTEYNLNLARQLVAEFKSETGLPSLEVTIPSTTSSIDYSIWASLQSMWADAGIVLNIIQEESAIIIAKAVNAGRLGAEQNFYDLVPLTMSFGSESGYNSMFFRSDAFNPNTTNPSFPSGSVHRTKLATVINFSHQPDNIMDQKLLEAHAQPTLKLAGVKYREAIKHYQQNAYAIPVVNGFLTAFTSKRIAGIGTSYLATGVPEKFMNAGGPNWSVVYRTAENVSRSISATNIDINKEVWTGAHPQGVVALSAETAYAPRTEEGEICRVSMELGSVATCTYVGGRPIGLISDKDKVDGFFLDLDTKKVRRMTFSTSSVVDIATIPGAPFAIAVNSEKSTGFVSSIETGKIYRIDLNQGVVTSTIDVPGGPSGIVIGNGGKALWVAQSLLGTIKKIPLGSSSVVHVLSKHELSVVQTANAVSTVQQYEIVVGSRPTGLSISPDGKLLLVANENDDTVSMVSTETNVVQATLSVPGQPRYLSFGDVTNRALVAGVFSNSIADIRLPTVGSTTPVETPNLDVPQTGGPGQPVETPPLPASGPGTAVVPNPISSPKPTLLVARIGRSLSSKQLLAAGKISVKPKSKIKIKIAAGSSKVCKALGTNVKALKPGTCRVSIEVTPPKGKKTLRTISFKVTK